MKQGDNAQAALARLEALNKAAKHAELEREADRLLERHPDNAKVHALRGNALFGQQRLDEASKAYARAAELGDERIASMWYLSGECAHRVKQSARALHGYQRALRMDMQDYTAMSNLIVLYNEWFSTRHELPLPLAMRMAGQTHENLGWYKSIGHVFSNNKQYARALEIFARLNTDESKTQEFMSGMLWAAQHGCYWDLVDSLTGYLGEQVYSRKKPLDSLWETPLYHVAWCMRESWNDKALRAGAQKTLRKAAQEKKKFDHARHRWGDRLRIGYVSWDFCDHATLHLIGGVIARHDRERFEIFAYDYSPIDSTPPRKRFEVTTEHIIDIRQMSDREAAERIYADGIDILVDLKGQTGHHRLGIFALRPAPIQLTWLGFPGSSGMEQMDYILGDPIVTPPDSQAHYPEKFCRMPDSYQPNDYERPLSTTSTCRADWGLPEQGIVFCSFNQSYKIDRITFETWMQVLDAVPGSVLWVLDPGLEVQKNLRESAQALGIDSARIIFAARVAIAMHMARLQLADLCLDTRVYNGHTTTSDALWLGVPVVTARGTHFPSRVSASLLRAVGMEELIAPDMEAMAQLAIALAQDPQRLSQLREKLKQQRFIAPLYDTERFTRHLERACEQMAARAKNGLPPAPIDVEPLPARSEPFTGGLNICIPGYEPPRYENISDYAERTALADQKTLLQWPQMQCPLCCRDRHTEITKQPWAQDVLGIERGEWVQCDACMHIYTRRHWSEEGLEFLRIAHPMHAPTREEGAAGRLRAAELVRAVVDALGGFPALQNRAHGATWLDVDNDAPWLLASARECGLAATAVQRDGAGKDAFSALGIKAAQADWLKGALDLRPEVISYLGSLEREPFPDMLLSRARQMLCPGGVLLVGYDNAASVQWNLAAQAQDPALWCDPRRLHWFGTQTLLNLLKARGFIVQHMLATDAGPYAMAIVARRGED